MKCLQGIAELDLKTRDMVEQAIIDIEEACAEGHGDISDVRDIGLYTSKIVCASQRITPLLISYLQKGFTVEDILKMPIYEFHEDLRKEAGDIRKICGAVHKNSISIYVCPKCKQRDQTIEEIQTSSMDEARSVICTCNQCGHRWRAA